MAYQISRLFIFRNTLNILCIADIHKHDKKRDIHHFGKYSALWLIGLFNDSNSQSELIFSLT